MNKWRSRSWLNIGITQSRTFEVQLGDAGVHSCRLTQCWVSPMPENNQKQKNGSTQKPKGKRCFEESVLNHLCISTRPHVRIWVLYTVCSWWQSYGQRIGCCVTPKNCKNMQSTHGYIQSSIHIRWMDGQPQNQAGECLQFHIISSSPLTYWESLSKRSHGSHGRLALNLQDLCLQAMMNFSCSSKPVTQCVYHNSAGSVCDFVVSECSLRQNTLQGST